MINFHYRSLTGFYKGSFANRVADYLQIDSSFLELSKDLPSLDKRITTLESNAVGILTTLNFKTNSIDGSIIKDGTLSGSKLQNGSITGDKIVVNSLTGITDANISANAGINPSKINLSQLSHTQIKDIGSNTHVQIDTKLAQLFNDVGSTAGSPLSTSLLSDFNSLNSEVNSLAGSLANLADFVDPTPLDTTSQVVTGAINELRHDLQAVGASGLGIEGPLTSVLHSVARWADTVGETLTDSSVTIDSAGVIAGSGLTVTGNIGTASIPVQNLWVKNIRNFPTSDVDVLLDDSQRFVIDTGLGGNYTFTPSGLTSDLFIGVRSLPITSGYFNTIVAPRIEAPKAQNMKLLTDTDLEISMETGTVNLKPQDEFKVSNDGLVTGIDAVFNPGTGRMIDLNIATVGNLVDISDTSGISLLAAPTKQVLVTTDNVTLTMLATGDTTLDTNGGTLSLTSSNATITPGILALTTTGASATITTNGSTIEFKSDNGTASVFFTSQSTFLGIGAGANNSGGFENTFVGYLAGNSMTTNGGSTIVGANAGIDTTGQGNTFLGAAAGQRTTTGIYNVFIGQDCGTINTDGSYNTFIGGLDCGQLGNVHGSENIYLGFNCGNHNEGSDNTFIGTGAGSYLTGGSFNVFIGDSAGSQGANDSSNVIIGYNAGNLAGGTVGSNLFLLENNAGRILDGGFVSASGGGTSYINVNGYVNPNTQINLVNGTTGWYQWTMPFRGSAFKKLVVEVSGYTNGSTSTINYPKAFDSTPVISANNTGLVITTITASAMTVPIVAVAANGWICLEGF